MGERKFDVYKPEIDVWMRGLTIMELKKLDIFRVIDSLGKISHDVWFVAETDPFNDNPINPRNPRYAIRAKDYNSLSEAKDGRIVAVLFGD